MTNNPSTPPPPMPAKKRSALPWIFGGCGFLLLLCIVIAVVFFRSVSNVTLMNKQVAGPKTKSPPASEDSDSKPRSAPAAAPAGWVTYVNKREDHPKLRAEFLPFSISYPSAWTKKDAPDAFFDVQKVGAFSDDVLREVSINPVSFTNAPESEYDGGLDKIAGFLKQVLSNLQMGAKESVTMDGATGRAAPFHGQVKGAKYHGRAILICPKGLVRGLFFLTLEKESEAGETEKILQQFRW